MPRPTLAALRFLQLLPPLIVCLLNKWCWGSISAPEFQEISHAAVLSGCKDESIRDFARIGSYGTWQQNCHRDLLAKLPVESLVAPAYNVTIPRNDPKSTLTEPDRGECPVKLPCLWLSLLSNSEDLKPILDCFFGSPARVAEFWEAQDEKNPKFRQLLDALEDPSDLEHCYPIVIHSDAAEYQEEDSLLTVSFRGLLAEHCDETTMEDNLWITSYPKSATWPGQDGTLHHLWSWISWSLQCLFSNVWLPTGPFGEDLTRDPFWSDLVGKAILPGRFKAVVWAIAGDMENFQNEFGLRHQSSNDMCHLCGANKSDRPFNDQRRSAAWACTLHMVQVGLTHPIFLLPYMSVYFFALDVLHILDLGISAHMIGNLFFDLVFLQLPGNREANLKTVWTHVLQNCQDIEHGKGLTRLEFRNFTDWRKPWSTYPCMSHVKAAHVRKLVPLAAKLAIEYNTGSPAHQHRADMLANLDAFYTCLYEQAVVPDFSVALMAAKNMQMCLEHYSWLAADALEKRHMMYSEVPKHHYAVHLAQQNLFLNAAAVWTYGGESYVGKASRLAMSCNKGTASFDVPYKMCEKIDVAHALQFANVIGS